MAKKPNGYPGLPIKLKRTKRNITTVADKNIINADGALADGELLLLQTNDLVLVGDGVIEGYDCQNLKAISIDSQALAAKRVFLEQDNSTNRVLLKSKANAATTGKANAFYPLINYGVFEVPTTGWKKITSIGTDGQGVMQVVLGGDATDTDLQAGYELTIAGMTAEALPIIGLYIDTLEATTNIRAKQKNYSNISAVYSDTNKIILLSLEKRLVSTTKIMVFGG